MDSIDGTRNFLKGMHTFALSIGVSTNGELVGGAVYNPVLNFFVCAEQGKGLFYNNQLVTTPRTEQEPGAISFGFGRTPEIRAQAANLLAASYRQFSTRHLGCSALELAYVALGTMNAHVVIGIQQWDYAGGMALVKSHPNGIITDFQGNPCNVEERFAIASSAGPAFHAQLVELVQTPW